MASDTLSASTIRNSGVYEPPISTSHALPNQPPGLRTGMPVRLCPLRVQEAVILLIGLTPSGWVLFASAPVVSGGSGPRWTTEPGSHSSLPGGSYQALRASSVAVGHEGVDPVALDPEPFQASPDPP